MEQEKAPLLERSSSRESGMTIRSVSDVTRRSRLYLGCMFLCVFVFLRVILFSFVYYYDHPHDASGGDKYMVSARRILSEHPLIDGHDDLLIALRMLYGNKLHNNTFTDLWENGGMYGQVDIPRLEQGQMGGAFWSAWVPCPANGTDFSDENYAPLVKATYEQIDLFNRLSTLYPKYFTLTPTVSSAEHAFKHDRLISPLGIEGLHQIGNSASTLRLFYNLGVRYATLTWNCHNAYADAALTSDASGHTVASTPLWHGISRAGRALIHEMNRMGMLVDLSHTSADTMRDVLHGSHNLSASPSWIGSLAPPIFSHSSAWGVCPHPRNVPDDVLHLVHKRRGLVMVNVLPEFIACVPSDDPSGLPEYVPANATLAQVVRHIMYIGELVGYDHVGIGTDFDGMEHAPEGFDGVDKFPDLVAELLRRGVKEKDVAKVVGRNLLRVWREAEKVSERMIKDGWLPLEDTVEKLEE